MNVRTLIGLTLATVILISLYNDWMNFLIIGINLAVFYDLCWMKFKSGLNYSIILSVGGFMGIFNYYLYLIYLKDPSSVIIIILIAQVSDVYQYIGGRCFGLTYIGWISEKKTFEGYIGGLILTIITFRIFIHYSNIIQIYLLGVIGGLISSYFKRKVCIKDYSNLLGPHGGWIDRIDSIILPLIFTRIY